MHQFGQPPLKTVYVDPFPFRRISSEFNIKTVVPNPRSGNSRTQRLYVTGKWLPGENFPLICDLMVQFLAVLAVVHPVILVTFYTWSIHCTYF
jgi:hypothetical protein